MIMEQNHVNSRRLLSLFAALFIVSFCFVGLIPSAYAATSNVILSSEPVRLTGTGNVPLYVDEDTPLTFQYFIDHPEYSLHVQPANTSLKWTFNANGDRLYFGEYGYKVIDAAYVSELASSNGNVSKKMNVPLSFNNEDSSYSKDHTLWCEVEVIPVDPYDFLLKIVDGVSSTSVNVAEGILDWISSSSLLMFVLVGIPVAGLIVYLISKQIKGM